MGIHALTIANTAEMKTRSSSILSAIALLFIIGCQQAPQEQLDAARAALMQADSVEADLYVSELYVAALDSFNAAQSEIEAEDAKSGFSRDYGNASELLAYTQQTAADAAAQVEERKEAVRVEADSLISLAQAALAANPAPTAAAVTDTSTPSVTALVNDAIAARDAGDYKAARDLAQAAVDQVGASAAPAAEVAPLS